MLTEPQAIQVVEVAERLRQVESMLAQAKEIGNPHIIITFEQARHILRTQCFGARQTDPAVARDVRGARERDEDDARESRRKVTAARAQAAADRRAAARGSNRGAPKGEFSASD